jgi:riboflavin kinase / FMN adenylyltransferase
MSSILTLGTFDGVHRGHQAILRRVVQLARRYAAVPVALSFAKAPRHVKSGKTREILLTTLPEKRELFKRFQITHIDVLRFDKKTAATPADVFFTQRICKRHHARAIVVGPRVAFGRNREGRLRLLRHLGTQHNVRIEVIPPVQTKGGAIASRKIRAWLTKGEVGKAWGWLGYPYFVSGPVRRGRGRGRRIGFPTANVAVPPEKILPRGVYWVKVAVSTDGRPVVPGIDAVWVDGLCNVGTRPTFERSGSPATCEVFMLKRKEVNLYGRIMTVAFFRRIRAERRFSSATALRRQIASDHSTAVRWSRQYSLHPRELSL